MTMRGSTALESANALFRRAQAPANAERLCTNIWDGVTATRSTRRWLHRGRAFAVAPSSFALDIPHVAFRGLLRGALLARPKVTTFGAGFNLRPLPCPLRPPPRPPLRLAPRPAVVRPLLCAPLLCASLLCAAQGYSSSSVATYWAV